MKLKEIANEIYQYLKKFENNPDINKTIRHTTPYYLVNCWATTKKVYIRYVDYQSASKLTKEEALKYLNWLKEGNIGKDWKMT